MCSYVRQYMVLGMWLRTDRLWPGLCLREILGDILEGKLQQYNMHLTLNLHLEMVVLLL